MSFFTPADAEYVKGSVRKIEHLSATAAVDVALGGADSKAAAERDAELARLEEFIDGCTLEKGKGE